MICIVYQLGLVNFYDACRMQHRLQHKRLNGKISDVLLILEHPPTFSIGKSGSFDNLLISKDRLNQEGIALFSTQRGGDVTYHGPGQIVVYPIISLEPRGKDIHRYVYELEEVVIRTLKDFCINAVRDENHPGAWVRKEEIAAIGLRIQKWITMHGFALNVCPDLKHFSFINPCGFSDRKATSMSKLLGHKVSMKDVVSRLIAYFSDVFNAQIKSGSYREADIRLCQEDFRHG